MAALPYMQFYVADYLADTAHLTAVEHGAYLLLLMNYWQRGKALPDDDERLAIIIRMPVEQWLNVRSTIVEFFDNENGFLVHRRVEKDLEKVRRKSEKAARAGVASGEKRSTKSTPCNGRSTDVQRTLNHTYTDTDTDIEKERDLKVSSPPDGGPPLPVKVAFDEFCLIAVECGLSVPAKLTTGRRSALQVRLREHGIDAWRKAIANIRGSPFLRGENERGWRADLDFVLQAKSFNRLLEGGYSGTHKRSFDDSVERAIAAGFEASRQLIGSGGS